MSFDSYLHTSLLETPTLCILTSPPGAGKTTLAHKIQQTTRNNGNTAKIVNLDNIREKNPEMGQKYIIEIFKKELECARERLIIVDNTNMRFTPDWKELLEFANKKQRNVISWAPEYDEYSLFTNRSLHDVPEDVFFSFLQRWCHFNLSPFLFRLIQAKDIPTVRTVRNENWVRTNKIVRFINHGMPAMLYHSDNYVGYTDSQMINATLHGGHIMRKHGFHQYFLQRNGMIHITLVAPYHVKAKEDVASYIEALASLELPDTEYTGLATSRKGDKQSFFLTISEKSRREWDACMEEACRISGTEMHRNRVGLHVTIGFVNGDIHDTRKDIEPEYPFLDDVWGPAAPVVPYFVGDYVPPSNIMDDWRSATKSNIPKDPPLALIDYIKKMDMSVEAVEIPPEIKSAIEFLVRNKKVGLKWIRYEGVEDTFHLMQVCIKSASSDNEIYLASEELQRYLPRGLTYVFKSFNRSRLQLKGIGYPTSKFFGDEDTDDGVEIQTEKDLQQQLRTTTHIIATEKANGEMFSISVPDKSALDFILILGSKNCKVLYRVNAHTTMDEIMEQLNANMRRLSSARTFPVDWSADRKWTMNHLWAEMAECFFKEWLALPYRMSFLERLHEEKLTVCGEFESYHHPHIVKLAHGHQKVKYFAITTYQADGTPKVFLANERICHLKWLQQLGFSIVHIDAMKEITDLEEYREQMAHQRANEGYVLLCINAQSEIVKLLKMKSHWYVLMRVLRSCMTTFARKFSPETSTRSLFAFRASCADRISTRMEELKTPEASRKYWQDFVRCMYERLLDMLATESQDVVQDLLSWNFPQFMEDTEKLMNVA